MRHFAMILAALAFGAHPAARADVEAKTLEQAFAAAADSCEKMAQAEKVVGGSIYFIDEGPVIGARHFGMADEARGQAVDADTIFHWASITKTITAIGAMQLVWREMLDLDAPVTRYLPEFGLIHNPFGPASAVTVRHLLTHSSGLRESTWPWHGDGAATAQSWQPHSPTSWSQLLAMMPYTGLAFAPGTQYSYSNPGITFLGRIIEVLSGDDIEVYLDKNVLKPLGMTRSYFDLTPWHLRAHRSNSYTWREGKRIENGREFDTGVTTGNGGLNAPVGDMIRYMNFLLGVGDTRLYEQILPRSTLTSMWEPLFETDHDETVEERMAQAFFTIDARGVDGKTRRFVGHTGSQEGYRAFLYVLPGAQAGVIMAVNTTGPNPRPFFYNCRRAFFERVFPLADQGR